MPGDEVKLEVRDREMLCRDAVEDGHSKRRVGDVGTTRSEVLSKELIHFLRGGKTDQKSRTRVRNFGSFWESSPCWTAGDPDWL